MCLILGGCHVAVTVTVLTCFAVLPAAIKGIKASKNPAHANGAKVAA